MTADDGRRTTTMTTTRTRTTTTDDNDDDGRRTTTTTDHEGDDEDDVVRPRRRRHRRCRRRPPHRRPRPRRVRWSSSSSSFSSSSSLQRVRPKSSALEASETAPNITPHLLELRFCRHFINLRRGLVVQHVNAHPMLMRIAVPFQGGYLKRRNASRACTKSVVSAAHLAANNAADSRPLVDEPSDLRVRRQSRRSVEARQGPFVQALDAAGIVASVVGAVKLVVTQRLQELASARLPRPCPLAANRNPKHVIGQERGGG